MLACKSSDSTETCGDPSFAIVVAARKQIEEKAESEKKTEGRNAAPEGTESRAPAPEKRKKERDVDRTGKFQSSRSDTIIRN